MIRLSSMGDVVLSTSVLEPLLRGGFDVYFVTKKAFAPLLEHHPQIRGHYAFDASAGEAAARDSFFAWGGSQGFSLVLDLQDSWRTRLWRRTLRCWAPVRVAHKERIREWLILYLRMGRWMEFGAGGRAKKFRRAAIDALASLQVFSPSGGVLTSLKVDTAERNAVRALLPEGDFVAVLPGSAWKGKEWPYFPQLAQLMSRKVPVVALGAEKDFSCDEVARSASAHPGSRSLRGKTSLRESMAVLAEARWVIGNDTGMVHVAEALGKDVAMVEGPTHESMGFSPYKKSSVLLGLNLFCRPCSKSGRFCPRFGTRKCLRGLSVASVADELRRKGFPC